MSVNMFYDLLLATGETVYMVLISSLLAVLLGLPLGIILYLNRHLSPNTLIYRSLSSIMNIFRSIPFIILMVALMPLTRLLAGTSIGTNAALVPLTLGAIPFFGRLAENVFQSLPLGLIDNARAMGSNRWQFIKLMLLPESLPRLINAITVTAITLVNYSAMAGTVGGGGLGDLAIRYGYQRFDVGVMLSTVILLILIVQVIQAIGDYLVRRLSH